MRNVTFNMQHSEASNMALHSSLHWGHISCPNALACSLRQQCKLRILYVIGVPIGKSGGTEGGRVWSGWLFGMMHSIKILDDRYNFYLSFHCSGRFTALRQRQRQTCTAFATGKIDTILYRERTNERSGDPPRTTYIAMHCNTCRYLCNTITQSWLLSSYSSFSHSVGCPPGARL